MTVGNYLRHCSVTFGPTVARAVPALARGVRRVARGVRRVVLVWSISAVVLVSLNRWALCQFRMQFPRDYFKL